MEIQVFCPTCGVGNRLAPPFDSEGAPPCRGCSSPLPLARPEAGDPEAGPTVCAVCGDDRFYIQKRFNQKLGCAIVGAGALLVPWTYGVSLAVCALVDLALYRLLPMITVCYVCGSRYLGWSLNPDHRPYDLMTAQTYEARSLTWRRLHDHSASPSRSEAGP